MSAIYESTVRHARTKPFRYAFSHRTYYWLVDIDEVPPQARVEARDHLGDPEWTIRRNLEAFVGRRLGRVQMLTQGRVWGYVFNPLTVYWCRDRAGAPDCVVAEVHNTYGQRHCYLLRPDSEGALRADKQFYVSPFFEVQGEYRMSLPEPGEDLSLVLTLELPSGRPFTATVSGTRLPATQGVLRRMAIRYPWSTLAVMVGIKWHGIRLYLKGLPVVPRPVRGKVSR